MDSSIYKLTTLLKGHDDDVRGVLFPSQETVVSVSRDATVRLWSRSSEDPTQFEDHVNSTGAAFINAVAYMEPTPENPKGLIISGGMESIIDVREPKANNEEPKYMLLGHSHNVCALDAFKTTIVSGSWDGTARVWKDWETQYVLEGHSGTVWAVLALSETDVATGGADATIRLWRNGKQYSVLNGHTDCVRGLCRLPEGRFASCGNDATIRIWSIEGHEMQQLHGHTNYIYSISALASGELISSGEDRTVRVWKDGDCIQTITHPAISVWSVAVCPETGDIASGASDRYVRVFSRSQNRWASQETLNEFEQSIAASSIPSNQIGEIQKDKLPGPEILERKGKKDGQVIMIRNGENVEAHTWSASTGTWTNVGTVVDTAGGAQKKLFEGKEYDFVFDVDIKEGSPPLKLPYNASENPFEAARKFLEKNELPLDYLDTVGNWISQNSKGVSLEQSKPTGSESMYSTKEVQSRPKYIPHEEYLSITTANLAMIQKKVLEINQDLIQTSQKDISLNPGEISVLVDLCTFLHTHSSPGRKSVSPTITSEGFQILIKIITSWPLQHRLPALDLLRLLTAISSLPTQYYSNGTDIITLLRDSGSISQQNVNNTMLTTRAFVNMFQNESSRRFLSTRFEDILQLVRAASSDTKNRNLKVAEATLLLNYSVLSRSEKSFEKAKTILGYLTKAISIDTEPEAAFRNLIGVGTLLTIGGDVTEAAGLYDVKAVVKGVVERIKDHRIEQLGVEIGKLL
ncbi:WD40-repeat-containing domain protein [Geopyxis carbonaria]|nr:WD40-repeat-containing domain protein [Geopyxis carbonaria]